MKVPEVKTPHSMTSFLPATPDMGYIVVTARFLGREGQRLRFRADVHDGNGKRLARANPIHWIVEEG